MRRCRAAHSYLALVIPEWPTPHLPCALRLRVQRVCDVEVAEPERVRSSLATSGTLLTPDLSAALHAALVQEHALRLYMTLKAQGACESAIHSRQTLRLECL
jgi:hypothetical protein